MQLHRRITTDQIRLILDWYEKDIISFDEALGKLGIKRRRFYDLLKLYRNGKLNGICPKRTNRHRRLPLVVDRIIRQELEKEKCIIDNPSLPLKHYNYAAVRDEVARQIGREISAQTIRNRAKDWGYYIPIKAAKNKHIRIVLTTATGLLLQHDSSIHLWSPWAKEKWVLITTIDDYSRYLLLAEFVLEESAWDHIKALKKVILAYGSGGSYYTDNHAIFRFTKKMETIWRTPRKDVREVKTQWERTVKECGMSVIHALSPEAKGKIERPYRWLQDRIVRRCSKENVITIDEARLVLKEEVDRYNNHQVHSTTREIPIIRFERAKKEGKTVFKPFKLPYPYTSTKDIFCFKEERTVNGYSSISWRGGYIKVPKHIPEGARVGLHIIPSSSHPELRIWYRQELVQSILLAPKTILIKK